MIDETKLIAKLNRLIHRGTESPLFIRTDLSSIISRGLVGYSLNSNNQVNGIKIAGLSKENIQQILKVLINFKYLERLILYSDDPYTLPIEFTQFKKLKFIELVGVESLPKELFNMELPLYNNYSSTLTKNYSISKKKISERLRILKTYNPLLDIPESIEDNIAIKDFFLNLQDRNETAGYTDEVKLFCSLTEGSRKSIVSQEGIYIGNAFRIKDPPLEVLAQGIEAIKQYFLEKEKQGVERLYEAKIVIVGAGESGKTTLIRKLQDPNHPVPNAEDKRTEGIRVTTYPFKGNTKDGEKDIQANIWDFGGQELYHTTHQLFLTADTLYILLNDNRKNDTDFYYWLNIVTLRAGESSPILMVFNAKDNAARQIIPGEEIYSTFPNLIKTSIDVNFADKDVTAIKAMKQTIEGNFTCLDVLGKPFPAYWVKVRDALVKLFEEHINWAKFKEICEQNGIHDISQMQVLATTLNNLGVILYFADVFGLDDLIILKSQWCVDAIYSALDTKDIIDNKGKFNEQMLSKKWSGNRFAGNHLQLLRLMQHFDLCYKIEGSNDYIAPQLLPIEENRLSNTAINWGIVFQFDYIFMPAGLLTRLIARMSLYIKEPYAWRAGVVLEWEDGTIAEIIEHQLTHKIVIKISGNERKRRLLDIRKCLYDLQTDFKGLKFKESITCNCADCKQGGEATIFELKELEDDAKHSDDVTCRNGTRKKIPAKNILEGIAYDDKPRVFISYSHKNEEFKNEFRAMINPIEREGHWKVWDDRWLLPGDYWNKEIIKHLNEANVIVLLLTKEFFNSTFIYDIELARAIQRHETGEALIIGIIISDCMWEETPLSKIQILPKDGMPIDRHPHRNEVWKTVANKIKETINIRKGKNNRVGGWSI